VTLEFSGIFSDIVTTNNPEMAPVNVNVLFLFYILPVSHN